ncbi:MAG TPA: ABC transporter permease [Anaerolineales bacterium]|nr:ABC transporter permease [Anaerolineales bacterium]
MLIAQRNLTQEKTRLALSVGGVALAIMLVLILDGLLVGMFRQITAYLDHSKASIIVAQGGVQNLLGATSLLPPGTDDRVAGITGVNDVVPILSRFVILDLHGKKQPVYLIGYSVEIGGGPWEIAEGREPRTDREMVFDRVLAERHGLGIGDLVAVMDKDFRIVGLSAGTASWMTSFIFLRKPAVEELLRAPGATSYLLVSVRDGQPPEAVRDRIGRLDDLEVMLKSEMAANDSRLFGRFFSAPVRLMTGIAFLVGALVVGLVIYTATVERQREYGVLKALGARNRLLYQVVLAQALLAAILGTVLGMGLARAAGTLIMAARPQFLVVLQADMTGRAVVIGLGMALVAALLPARVVARLAPAEVFRR